MVDIRQMILDTKERASQMQTLNTKLATDEVITNQNYIEVCYSGLEEVLAITIDKSILSDQLSAETLSTLDLTNLQNALVAALQTGKSAAKAHANNKKSALFNSTT